jgi:hypothetical protein
MSLRRSAAVVCLAVLAAAPAAAAPAAAASASAASLKVASSLDGKTVLPHRIPWVAFMSIPETQISQVDYLIDAKLRWVGHGSAAKYTGSSLYYSTYSDTGGYLVTSWLAPGLHRFTVRVVALDGQTASDTVVARVLPAPIPPAALAGSWQRTINTAAAPAPGSSGNPTDTYTPDGTYTITFSRKWIEDHVAGKFTISGSINGNTGAGEEYLSDWTPGPKSFHVQGAVSIQPFDSNTDQLGGWWCNPGGPGANYSWTVHGNVLTLGPIGGKDACGIRGFIWTGTWARVAN